MDAELTCINNDSADGINDTDAEHSRFVLFTDNLRPVLISFPDIALPVLIPDFLDILVEIKVEFAVDD